jgi:transposase-like protein
VAALAGADDSVLPVPTGDMFNHLHHQCHCEPAYALAEHRQKNRGHFPSDEAATKLLYLALRNIEKDQKMPRTWKIAANQFAILFGERLTNAINLL